MSLALAMGLAAAAYTLLYAVLLRPFPYKEPARLVYIWGASNARIARGLTTESIGVLSSSRAFHGLSLFLHASEVVIGDDPTDTTLAVAVDGSFLRILGAKPILGRGLTEGSLAWDERELLISFDAWRTRFGARADIVGTPLVVDGVTRTIVGVMPEGFFFPEPRVRFWVPHRRELRTLAPGGRVFVALARLATGSTLESARAEITSRLTGPGGDSATRRTPAIGIFSLTETAVGDYRQAVWSLAGAAVSLLLIVVANVGAFFLIRVDRRQQEFAIRAALGATAGRLYRQLVAEQLLVIAGGGMFGLMVAQVWVTAAKRAKLLDGSRVQDATVDLYTLAVLLAVALVVFPVVGLVAARRLRSAEATSLLKAMGAVAVSPPRAAQRGVVLFELAVTPPLLLIASLFFWNVVHLARADWGFEPAAAAVVEVKLPAVMERRLDAQAELTERVLHSIGSLPGVAAAGMGYHVPLLSGMFQRGWYELTIDGRIVQLEASVESVLVSHGYFRALGIEIVRGREFAVDDGAANEPVAVINTTCARLLFRDTDPIGHYVCLVRKPFDVRNVPEPLASVLRKIKVVNTARRIVGVVGDVRMATIDDRVAPRVYIEYRQQDEGIMYGFLWPRFIVRTKPDHPSALSNVIRCLRTEPGVTVRRAAQMQDLVDGSIGTGGSHVALSSAAALLIAIAVVMVGVGVHGLFADVLGRRERECGVRIALGAAPWTVVGELAREVVPLIALGVGLGLAACLAGSGLFRAYVAAEAPGARAWVSAGVVLGLTLCASAAGPLWRALRLDPVRLLRSE